MYRFLAPVFVLALSLSLPARAQFEKGMRMTGGTIGAAFFNAGNKDYTSGQPNTNGYTSKTNVVGFNLAPNYGWFLTENTVVGTRLILGYKHSQTSDLQNDVTFRRHTGSEFSARLGLFGRRYFGSGGVLPFVQADADAGTGASKSDGFFYGSNFREDYTGKSSGVFYANAGLSVGITKMLTETAGIDIYAGYLYSYEKQTYQTNSYRDIGQDGSIDEEGVEKITTKSRNNGLVIGIGFQLFLGRK